MQLAAVEAIHIGFAAGGLVVGAVAAIFISKFMGAQTLGNAKKQSDELLSRAKADAQTIQKQIELDARNELAKRREKFESELEGSRNEVKETERRLIKREDNLDRKLDVLTTKEKYLDDLDGKIKSREKSVAAKEAELDSILVERKELLEKAIEHCD